MFRYNSQVGNSINTFQNLNNHKFQNRIVTEPLPNQYGSGTEPITSKERKKQRKKERKDYYPSGEKDKEQIQKKNNLNGNEFEADTIMQDVFNLFEENKFKLSHSQYNEVNSLIEEKKHLSAQTKLYEYLNLTENQI